MLLCPVAYHLHLTMPEVALVQVRLGLDASGGGIGVVCMESRWNVFQAFLRSLRNDSTSSLYFSRHIPVKDASV